MDFNNVKELISIIDSSNLREFQLNMDNVSVSMSKNEGTKVQAADLGEKPTPKFEPEQATPTPTEAQKPVVIDTSGEIVKAPIVGTFYASPGAGKANFVTTGSKVLAGDTLCILEAMKIMNEIVSPCDGQIAEIYVQNEALVEYGQPLFRII